MTDTMTGSNLAGTIEKIVTMFPDNHDQSSWFHIYDTNPHTGEVDPESIQLVQILDAVENENAEEDKAKEVTCGATLCTAGWALMLNGYKLARNEVGYEKAFKDGQELEIFEVAMDLLDIDKYTADVLFDGDTDNEDAVEILHYLADGDKVGARDYIAEMREEDGYERCGCGCDDDRSDYDY